MPIAPPLVPPDEDAVRLFRAEMPAGAIPAGAEALADAIAGGSPYLRQLMLRDPVFAGRVFREDADHLMGLQLEALRNIPAELPRAGASASHYAPQSCLIL